MKLVAKFLSYARTDTDLFVLFCAATIFAILGFLGIGTGVLDPVVLSLLGILALSQLRSREQISEVASTWRRQRTDLLLTDFPEDYRTAQRMLSHNYFFTGITMNRTLQIMRTDLARVLRSGGSVRILLPDPRNAGLMEMIAETRAHRSAEHIRGDIVNSLRVATELGRSTNGDLAIRTIQFLPGVGINAMDLGYPTKSVMVQIYEFNPEDLSEPAPIFFLTAADRAWINHYEAQVKRLWDNGKPFSGP